ncbi:MAG TPA: ADOP family duplicated permease [Acidobacteriota bacterium]|nr:ADOP family duplicated permease [Acidobacteriota bacterium]
MLIDVKHAVRALRRWGGPLVVSMLSLSLGIAATATMLAVVDAIDFRPIPFRQADQLVDISVTDPARPDFIGRVSPGIYLDWKQRSESAASLAAASSIMVSLQEGGGAVDAARVSDNFFSTLGVAPAAGRVFSADEVNRQARVAVISYDLWQSVFGADRQVIGQAVQLSWAGEFRSVSGQPYTVVGVLPPSVRYPRGTQVWIPAGGGFGDSRSDAYLTVTGRLRQDVSLSAARAEFETISAQLTADFPRDYGRRVAKVSPLRDAIRASVEDRGAEGRFPLLGIAAFVLLLAVFNVTGLFLARTAAQVRELRVRLALGASRARLASLLLTQGFVLSLGAGLLGILLSHWFIQLVSSRLEVAESGTALVLDERFLLSAMLLSLLTGILVALLPLWRVARLRHSGVWGNLSSRGAGIARTGALQRSMVVGQVALAVMLLSGAGLLSTEFLRLVTKETGFNPEGLLVASLPLSLTASPQESIAQAGRVEDRIAQLPGIASAALGGLPGRGYSYRLEDGDELSESRAPMSFRVSPGYFAAMQVELEAGREFTSSDREGSAAVGIVNRLAADLWWPDQEAVGKVVSMAERDGSAQSVRIVGVVDNERVIRRMTWEFSPVLYRPFGQLTDERRRVQVFARTQDQTEATVGAVNRIIEETRGSSGWQGEQVVTMESLLGSTLLDQRFRAWALSLLSLLALVLAAMGIYGIVATMVAQRTAEIGLRIALGARPFQVLTLVSRQGIVLSAIGFALGLAGSVAVTGVLQSALEQSTGFDPRIPLAAGAVLAGAVLIACYFPAQRASRIDPAPLLQDG